MRLFSIMVALAVAVVLLVPALAEACPTCAKRDGVDIYYTLDLLAMVALPFAIAGVVFAVVRRVSNEAEVDE